MEASFEFISSAFPKYENEENELVNGHLWGKRLAEYLRDHLPTYGVATEDILAEDWGWLVHLKHDAFPLWVGCGVMDEDGPDGDDEDDAAPSAIPASQKDAAVRFAVFVTAEPGFFKSLFRRVDTRSATAPVNAALRKMMADRPDLFQEVSYPPL